MTRMARMLAAVALLCLASAGSAAAQAAPPGGSVHKIVVQVNEDDPKRWALMLNNVDNLIAALGKDHVDIKIVTYGPGINMLRKGKSSVLARLQSLKQMAGKDVEFTVCSNTLKTMNVDRQEIVEFVDDFYPGIVRIVEL